MADTDKQSSAPAAEPAPAAANKDTKAAGAAAAPTSSEKDAKTAAAAAAANKEVVGKFKLNLILRGRWDI